MPNDLVIVESPAKAKTIERYLGPGFTVLASFGHVRDLPRSNFAVELDGDGRCRLVYEVPEKSKKHVAALKKAAKGAPTVWLAPDLDREGEAIAWHVAEVLGLDPKVTKRVTFDEITEPAIRAAFASPRTLDTALVDAQQARRAVDRIVGYRLSPVLWRTVSSGISAGRVQSVALRLIIDREDEIRAFVPETYFDFPSLFAREGAADVAARLALVDGARLATPKDLDGASDAKAEAMRIVRTEDEAEAIAARARGLDYVVREVRRTEARRQPKPPFKTSTLQGEGSRLGFSARQTMAIAQQLYEGVSLGGEQVGLITYMRTDSLNLSAQALTDLTAFVRDTYGERYAIAEPRRFATTAKGAQEAHEAIRPTSVARTPESIRRHLTNEQARLYEVIWQRTVATQMAPAVFDRVSVDVVGGDAAGELVFRVSGQVERFDGYLRAYREARDEDELTDEDGEGRLPDLSEGQTLTLASIEPERHETSPPPRFSERTLVEVLEELGIGRPSTYASIISTLEQRDYVIKESRRFFPTALGEVVVAFLKAHFPEIVDVNFTARMEETLDEIASGSVTWGSTVTSFLDEVDEWVRERKPERPRLPLKVPTACHLCGAPMERVFSGKSKSWFASCSRWPDCDGTLPLEADGSVGEPEAEAEPDERVRCPKCAQPMLLRSGRYGRFYSCVDYPGCKGIRGLQQRLMFRDADGVVRPFRSPTDPTAFMELRTSRYGKPFVGSTRYPEDVFAVWSLPLATPCPECGSPLRQPPRNRRDPIAVCAHPVEQHVFELEDFELPTVATWTVVDGVEAFDPELGGEPIAVEEPPMPIAMTLIGTQAPPAKRPGRGRFAAKDGDAGDEATEAAPGRAPRGRGAAAKPARARKAAGATATKASKKTAKKATKSTAKERSTKSTAKEATAKVATKRSAAARSSTSASASGVGGTGRQPASRTAAARKAAATAKDGRGARGARPRAADGAA